jgi:hypothetical protein
VKKSKSLRRKPSLPGSVGDLKREYPELEGDEDSGLDGGDTFLFVKEDHHSDVTPPTSIPYIVSDTNDAIYFLIPSETDLPNLHRECASPYLVASALEGSPSGFIPESEYWPDEAEIIEAINQHHWAVVDAQSIRQAKELLKQERQPTAGLYASAARIDQETPMLIEGLMRERGVSVFYGAFDEFKTTLALDMIAHVATGVPWQGRDVMPRPVIWYALEGKEEVPVRLKALEASLKGKDSAWGDDHAPVTVLDRIPEDYRKWRAEIHRYAHRWENVYLARYNVGDLPTETIEYELADGTKRTRENNARYPHPEPMTAPPVIGIDTFSIALGGEDEKGSKAAGFITNCLDLLKTRPDMSSPEGRAELKKWEEQYPDEPLFMDYPAASHVIIIHHQTKTGTDFAGHRAIGADTSGLYRVHRFGKMADRQRPYAGQLTPIRVKGIPRPAPVRFDVDVVPVEGTKQTAAILNSKTKAIPKKLMPIIEALRELEDHEEIGRADLNDCLDVGFKGTDNARRVARKRSREDLEAAGVLEPVEDDNGKVAFYSFHDTGAV